MKAFIWYSGGIFLIILSESDRFTYFAAFEVHIPARFS